MVVRQVNDTIEVAKLLSEFGFRERFPESEPGIFTLVIGRFTFSLYRGDPIPDWEFRILHNDITKSPVHRFNGPLGKCLIQASIFTARVLASVAKMLETDHFEVENEDKDKKEW